MNEFCKTNCASEGRIHGELARLHDDGGGDGPRWTCFKQEDKSYTDKLCVTATGELTNCFAGDELGSKCGKHNELQNIINNKQDYCQPGTIISFASSHS